MIQLSLGPTNFGIGLCCNSFEPASYAFDLHSFSLGIEIDPIILLKKSLK